MESEDDILNEFPLVDAVEEEPAFEQQSLRDAALLCCRLLQDAGYQAYFAGGCVRDQLMGREPKDYDIATNATPKEIESLFHKSRGVGAAFGVMLVYLKGCCFEVATFRKDGNYSDGRRPDEVTFSSAEEDAERRDFTINGMFYDPIAQQVHDYVNGQEDLKAGIIRCIGNAEQRFSEDYLRMLRAVRFTARYAFELEADTSVSMRQNARKLKDISTERIGQESKAMMRHPNRGLAIQLLIDHDLDQAMFKDETWLQDRKSISLVLTLPDDQELMPETVMAAWMLDRYVALDEAVIQDEGLIPAWKQALDEVHWSSVLREWRRALVLSNTERDLLSVLPTRLAGFLKWPDHDKAHRKLLLLGEAWEILEPVCRAWVKVYEPGLLEDWGFDQTMAELIEEGLNPTPLISGDDLIAAGHQPGPFFKRVLELVYMAQLNLEIVEKDEAMKMADEWVERLQKNKSSS